VRPLAGHAGVQSRFDPSGTNQAISGTALIGSSHECRLANASVRNRFQIDFDDRVKRRRVP